MFNWRFDSNNSHMKPRDQFCSSLGSLVRGFTRISSLQLVSCWEHYELLQSWNRVINLTTVVELEAAAERHYAESFFLAAHLPPGKWKIADMGSGAGFPGFPCALFRSDCQVSLVESVGKKAAFLRESCHLLNVEVIHSRAEETAKRFDWVVSRAVRPMDVVQWADQMGAGVSILAGRQDAEGLEGFQVIDLPWGENRVLAIRDRST
jgi:16S rRNA (guanine(527)-N(7))-methyltransferase RsmG